GMDPVEAARLKDACQQFEALFLQQLLKEARAGAAALSGGNRSFDREVYEGWQDEQFATALSGSGGIGLAEMLFRQLGGTDAAPPTAPPVAGKD
ncbi:MAG: rod-binding protein, partial [Bacillota bacterium]